MTTDSLPLQRFTIVEVNDAGVPLCLRLATSLAGKIAADLGADVLKIEPPGGDPVRRAPPLLPSGARRCSSSSIRPSAPWFSTSGPRPAVQISGTARAQPCLPVRGAGLDRAPRPQGKATPIEIAAFPRKWMPQRDRSASSSSRRWAA